MEEIKPGLNIDSVLICSICSDLVLDPYTLQQCFHTFCKTCVLSLNWKTQQGKAGVFCPRCKTFSKDDEVKRNLFIIDLLEKQTLLENNISPICKQCPEAIEATQRCTDCKIYLCEICKIRHLAVPVLIGHTVIPFEGTEDPLVDKLLICGTHKDKPMEFNCRKCEKLICIKCKVINHEHHKTETIEMALERLTPILKDNIRKIKTNVKLYSERLKKIQEQVKEVSEEFEKCKEDIKKYADDAVVKIRATQTMVEYDLQKKEESELEKLTQICEQLQSKKDSGRNFCKMVALCLFKSRHMSQLSELQGALFNKVETYSKPIEYMPTFEPNTPKLMPNYETSKLICQQNFLGKLYFGKKQLSHGGLPNLSGTFLPNLSEAFVSKFMDVDFALILSKQLKKEKTVVLPFDAPALHLSIIQSAIWICITRKTVIEVYSFNGTLERSISFSSKNISPHAVQQISDNNVILACQETGLYEITTDGKITQRITEGKFCDICVHENEVFALELERQQVQMFNHIVDTYDNKYILARSILTHEEMPSLNLYSTFIVDNESIYICANAMPIFKYSKTGNFLCRLGEEEIISSPALSGIDSTNSLLITEYERNCLIVIDERGKYKSCYPHKLEKPANAIVDGDHIWLLQESNKKLTWKLVKYSFTNELVPEYSEAYQFKPDISI